DPELGFCICGHVYDGPAHGKPHDHGESWAIYGQASETTEMTDWTIVEKGDGARPNLVEPVRTYTMQPGDQHLYDVGDVHSPRRPVPADPHRGQEPRPREAQQHQGEVTLFRRYCERSEAISATRC